MLNTMRRMVSTCSTPIGAASATTVMTWWRARSTSAVASSTLGPGRTKRGATPGVSGSNTVASSPTAATTTPR